jgi:hypothetical protein
MTLIPLLCQTSSGSKKLAREPNYLNALILARGDALFRNFKAGAASNGDPFCLPFWQ